MRLIYFCSCYFSCITHTRTLGRRNHRKQSIIAQFLLLHSIAKSYFMSDEHRCRMTVCLCRFFKELSNVRFKGHSMENSSSMAIFGHEMRVMSCRKQGEQTMRPIRYERSHQLRSQSFYSNHLKCTYAFAKNVTYSDGDCLQRFNHMQTFSERSMRTMEMQWKEKDILGRDGKNATQ